MQQHGITADQVSRLVVSIPDKEFDVVNNTPMSDVCIQHLLPVMLLDGGLTFTSAHDAARMRDPRVLRLRKKVVLVGDPALTDAQRCWRCVMEITLADGRTLRRETKAAKGSYKNPLTPAEEEEKALDLMAPVLGRRRSAELLARLWNFEKIKDVRELRRLYAA
jgi:2-methylcitrate dehydratase PrpD